MAVLFNAAPVYDLPLTKGDDLALRFVYCELVVDDQGEPILDSKGNAQFEIADYPEGTNVQVEIDTRPTQQVFDADISGHDATIQVSADTMDLIPARLPWRVQIIFADGLTKVGAHGKTVRND